MIRFISHHPIELPLIELCVNDRCDNLTMK